MLSKILVLTENGIQDKNYIYSLEPKKALIAFIKQELFSDFNTMGYPNDIPEIVDKGNRFYFKQGDCIFGSFPVSKI